MPAAAELDALVRRFADGPSVLRAAWKRVPERARQWRPAPGKWSAHEVVVHCADAQANMCCRIRYVLAEKDPVVVAYDQDAWARELDYHAQPLETAFAVIDAVTANTVPLLARLTPALLARTARHTEQGTRTLGEWLGYYAGHNAAHAEQIERNVAAWERASV